MERKEGKGLEFGVWSLEFEVWSLNEERRKEERMKGGKKERRRKVGKWETFSESRSLEF